MKHHKYLLQKISDFFLKFPREYYVFGFFGLFLFMIIIKLFSFTVINHDYYSNLAQKQQTSTKKSPISRGNIYTSNEKGNILATSVSLNNLAIDPSLSGNKDKLSIFLTDLVYNEICYTTNNLNCNKNLIKFLGVLELPDYVYNEIYIKNKILEKIKEKISKNKLTSALIYENLTNQQIFDIDKLNLAGVYINGGKLYINPEEIADRDFIASKLSEYIPITYDQIKFLSRKRELRYTPILNKLSPSTSEFIKDKIQDEKEAQSKGFITQKDLITNFLILTPEHHRFYPENDMGSPIIGFVDNSGEGKYGIEGYFNNILKGKDLSSSSKKDILGRNIDPLSTTTQTLNSLGANITLTIDRNIQKAVEEIIDQDNKIYRANDISVIIMDPKTGYILSMASTARFDPNSPGDAYELERVSYYKYPNPPIDLLGARVLAVDNAKGTPYYYNGKKIFLREIQREELGNFALEKYVFVNKQGGGVYRNDIIQDLYEPGSIFKPIVMAAGIDVGEINRFDMYKDEGYVKIDNFKIKNASQACSGYHTFEHAMAFSCNVGMIRIAQKIGKSIFYKYIENFGFGKKTGITLDGEVYGKLTPYEKWSKAQLFTTSFGKGITATTLQMAAMYSVIANGGVYVKPQIVKSIEFSDGKKIINKPEITHRVLKESTAKTMTQVLVQSVKTGVAKKGGVEGYSIAGKTGTSQIAYKGKYEVGQASTVGAYAGFAPAEDPKFVMIIRINRPRSSVYGGETVAATFSKISQFMLNYYKIPPKK